VISPGPAPAIFVEADLGPAVGAGPVLIAPGPGADAGRWQAPGHCEATAYLPPPPGPITNAKHAGDPAVSILIERADGVRTVRVRADSAADAIAARIWSGCPTRWRP
jgi:hypothetical protein